MISAGNLGSGLLLLLSCCGLTLPAQAARAPDLYSAEVEVQTAARSPTDQAFADALAQVLVKLTGRRAAADPATLRQIGDPAALVQQYRTTVAGRMVVGFDPLALRSAMDASGLPLWGEERPAVLVWLAVDSGRGQRDILAAAQDDAEPPVAGMPAPAPQGAAAARELIEQSGRQRGLPLLLPLVDGEDLGVVSFADLWGDFTAPVMEASRRYRADAVLIGRARGLEAGSVRWTLLAGGERLDWTGSLADGPEGTADRLAQRLAASAGERRDIRIEVTGVSGLDAYARLETYLTGLSSVDLCELLEVREDRAVFSLSVRGDLDQLIRTIALQRLLQPADPQPGAALADLHYMLVGG